MNKKEGEQRQITIYWWNLGTKTLDFKGPIGKFLEEKSIKVARIKHPSVKGIKGYRFLIKPNYVCRFDSWDDFPKAASNAIRIYLMLLGDKTVFKDAEGVTHKLNWR